MMWEGVICKCVKVGEAEKIGDTRNVDTINLSQDVVNSFPYALLLGIWEEKIAICLVKIWSNFPLLHSIKN